MAGSLWRPIPNTFLFKTGKLVLTHYTIVNLVYWKRPRDFKSPDAAIIVRVAIVTRIYVTTLTYLWPRTIVIHFRSKHE